MDIADKDRLMMAVDMLKVLSHPVRLSIACQLAHAGELPAGAFVASEQHAARQSHISQYLGSMRRMGMLATRKHKQTVYYRLASPHTRAVVSLLHNLYCAERSVL